jgi:hypothetical protein
MPTPCGGGTHVRNLTVGRGVNQGPTRGRTPETRVPAAAYGSQTRSGDRSMLRTIFMIGLFAIGGLFVLKVAFGLFGFALALLAGLLGLAIKIAIVGGLIYLVIRIFSPGTARRLRDRWNG